MNKNYTINLCIPCYFCLEKADLVHPTLTGSGNLGSILRATPTDPMVPIPFPLQSDYPPEAYSIVHMDHIFSIHSSLERHLGNFQVLPLTNADAMGYVCASRGYMPKNTTAMLLGRYSSTF